MAFLRSPDDTPDVSAALEEIEAALRPAFIDAINRINAVLADNPSSTVTLHRHAANLHDFVGEIDNNKQRQARFAKRRIA